VTYDLVTLPVDPFLAGLDALVAPQAAAKALSLDYETCDPSLAVVADREKLRQVLLNLLSNAIRYTPSGGRISLGAEPAGEHRVCIWVRDSGPGIPRERQEEIFAPFVQLDRSLTQSREGVGLGLAISRDLARGMDGDLRVESRSGEGACFVVELPRGAIADAVTLVTTAEIIAASARTATGEPKR
jgi:signal transduction histidine kinase